MTRLTPQRAIKAKCLECSCGSRREVELCPIKDCALYEWRTGHSSEVSRRRKAKRHEENAEISSLSAEDGRNDQTDEMN